MSNNKIWTSRLEIRITEAVNKFQEWNFKTFEMQLENS